MSYITNNLNLITEDYKKNIYYAGIGSRNTPAKWLSTFVKISSKLAEIGLILRSGAAPGADIHFEMGCDYSEGKKEIYLPWKNFNNSKSDLIVSDPKAFEIAKKYHPYWLNLKQGAKKLQARNSHQIFGKDLNTPSSFVVCYTKEGKGEGGTGQAIRIANDNNIKIFDAGLFEGKEFDGMSDVDAFEYTVLKYAQDLKNAANSF